MFFLLDPIQRANLVPRVFSEGGSCESPGNEVVTVDCGLTLSFVYLPGSSKELRI